MAKLRRRGFSTIEYPTGMNQNGDPSQAWIKLKPDGRVDVFAGTVDIGQGSKTVHTQTVADALGVPYDCLPVGRSPRGEQFGAYPAPSLLDLPEIDNVILENPSVDGPFGAKAIGEMANNAQPPAIAAAIHDAVGVWVTEMPATPERVLRALQAKAAPRREGKRVIFDEPISIDAVSQRRRGFPGRAWLNLRRVRPRAAREDKS